MVRGDRAEKQVARGLPGGVELRRARAAMLGYFDRHGRDLPWRATRDPYAIWVSEIMLQQTQVETVRPRYPRFLERFPDISSLARASEEQVCEAWAGLGYYRRARHLHAAARQVVVDRAGTLPATAAGLSELIGIGRYTAGAVASIAFGEPAPAVDGNIARLLARLGALDRFESGDAALWQLAEELVRGDRPGDVNQAMMDLGATVCTPRAPRCRECPVRRWCRGAAQGDPEQLPRRRPAARRRRLLVAFALVEARPGLWLRRRDLDGLWPGLWELPSASGPGARAALAKGLGVALVGPIARVRHLLTHRDVRASVYVPQASLRLRVSPSLRPFARPLAAPLSALARRAIEAGLAARRPSTGRTGPNRR